MTGNLMQIIVDTVNLMQRIAGTLCGAIGYTIAGFASLVVPIVTVSAPTVLAKSSPQQVHA